MRNRIIQTAAEQTMITGFRKFTMDSIALKLGVSKKTLYKHFPSKNALSIAVINKIVDDDMNKTKAVLKNRGSWLDRLDAVISCSKYTAPARVIAEIRKYYPDEWKKVEELKNYKVQQFHSLLKEGAAKGEINPAIQLDVMAVILEKTLDELLQPEFINNHELTIKQIIEQITDLFLYGIVKRN